MITFTEFLTYLSYNEVSSLFDREGFNRLFKNEIQKLISKTDDPEQQRQLIRFQSMDYVGYIDRSLRSAGFGEDSLDENVSEVIQHLVMGKFFKNWKGQPIEGRFKLSVRNAILNLVQKRNQKRKRYPNADIQAMGLPAPEKGLSQTLVDEFRDYLRLRAGDEAVQILDARLSNVRMKDLSSEFGSSYRVKEIVKVLKQTAAEFAADDPEYFELVRKAMEEDSEKVGKRFGK